MNQRPEGWEVRLIEVLRGASERPYDARSWNCARFAHAAAEAVSGRPIPFVWKGSLEASADAALPRIPLRRARCGDVMLGQVPEPSLGVCVRASVAFVTPSGLTQVPRSRMLAAWAV